MCCFLFEYLPTPICNHNSIPHTKFFSFFETPTEIRPKKFLKWLPDPFASFRNSNHKKIRFIEISIVLFKRNKNYSVCRLKCTNTRKGKYSKKKESSSFFCFAKNIKSGTIIILFTFRVGLIPKPDKHIFPLQKSLI